MFLTVLGLKLLLQAEPIAPSKGQNWGMWYILVIVVCVTVVGFWLLKRISDIAVKRKTDAMIREIGEDNTGQEKKE